MDSMDSIEPQKESEDISAGGDDEWTCNTCDRGDSQLLAECDLCGVPRNGGVGGRESGGGGDGGGDGGGSDEANDDEGVGEVDEKGDLDDRGKHTTSRSRLLATRGSAGLAIVVSKEDEQNTPKAVTRKMSRSNITTSADDRQAGSVKESDDGAPDGGKGCSSSHLSVRILPVFRAGQNERDDGKAGCNDESNPPSFDWEGDWEGKSDNDSDDDVFDLPPLLKPRGRSGVEDRDAFNEDEPRGGVEDGYPDNRDAFNDDDVDAKFFISEHWDEQQWDRSYSSAHVSLGPGLGGGNPRHPMSPVPFVDTSNDDETSASSPLQAERRWGHSGDGGGKDGGGDEVKDDEAGGHGTSISRSPRSPRNRSNRSSPISPGSPGSPSSPPALEDTTEISRRLDMGNMSSEDTPQSVSALDQSGAATGAAAVTTVIDVEGTVSSGYGRLERMDSFDANAHISSNHTYHNSSRHTHHSHRDPSRDPRNSHGHSHGDNHWNGHGNNRHGNNSHGNSNWNSSWNSNWNSNGNGHGNGDGHWRRWEYGVDGPDTAVTCACGAEYGSAECFREDAARHRSGSHDFRMGIVVR